MLNINPLTANTGVALVNSASSSLPLANTKAKPSYNELTRDIVDISNLGIERLHKDKESQTTKDIEQISNEAVSVTSTIGRNKSTDNLNHAQAEELYNKIASLL